MNARTLPAAGLTAALALWGLTTASPQVPTSDAELGRGIKQVNGGDFDKAVVTLEGVARRLAADPTRVRDLGWAHVYRGVALAGLEQAGKAKLAFREALIPMMVSAQRETGARGQVKDISLGEFGFSPKVIDLFEAAKKEALADPAWRRSLEAQLEREPGRKRSKTVPILLGLGLVGAAGAAAGLSGDGEVAQPNTFFRVVAANPPAGGTIAVSSPTRPDIALLRLTIAGMAPVNLTGPHRAFVSVQSPGSGIHCLMTQFQDLPVVSLTPGQAAQFDVALAPQVTICRSLPFTTDRVLVQLLDVSSPAPAFAETLLMSWNFVAAN